MATSGDKKIDVINEILEDGLLAFPLSSLLISLYQQYQRRGFLTKKQLRALHTKTAKAENISPGKRATLEAIIKKMPDRFKSEKPEPETGATPDAEAATIIHAILEKYPQHKRVLFLKSKLEDNALISSADMDELRKFQKLLK